MALTIGIILTGIAILVWLLLRKCEQHKGADWGGRWWNRLDGLNRLFCRHVHGLKADAIELPDSGGALLVSNHVSGLDPLLIIAACRRPVRFLIAREEYERFGLTWLFRGVGCIPVDRKGRPELALRAAIRALEQGEVVAVFPHGGIHLPSHPDKKLKAGVARMAEMTDSLVYPLRLEGIRGMGYTVLAVFMPSRARLYCHAPIACHELETSECLQRIAEIIVNYTDTPHSQLR